MRIGIVGGGTVGRAVARSFMEFGEVKVYDVMPERATHPLPEVLQSEIIFICLPTPEVSGHGRCDTSALDAFFASLDVETWTNANLVLRSTVPIGYTRSLKEKYGAKNLVHSPEFLTARCSITDAQVPARNIIGGPICECAAKLYRLYKDRFPGVPVVACSSDESEAIKLFTNGFFAVKVAFFNEIQSLSERLGLKWCTVLKGVLLDGRITHSHTKVPGPDGHYGFGGACLPKDLANLCTLFLNNEVPGPVTAGALKRNKWDRQR